MTDGRWGTARATTTHPPHPQKPPSQNAPYRPQSSFSTRSQPPSPVKAYP